MNNYIDRDVDWAALRSTAVQAATLAYCPYSQLRVGADGVADAVRAPFAAAVSSSELGGPSCLLDTPHGIRSMSELLRMPSTSEC